MCEAEFGVRGTVQPQTTVKGYGQPILYDIPAVYHGQGHGTLYGIIQQHLPAPQRLQEALHGSREAMATQP